MWLTDGTVWTWISGSATVNASGTYPSVVRTGRETYTPGARSFGAAGIVRINGDNNDRMKTTICGYLEGVGMLNQVVKVSNKI